MILSSKYLTTLQYLTQVKPDVIARAYQDIPSKPHIYPVLVYSSSKPKILNYLLKQSDILAVLPKAKFHSLLNRKNSLYIALIKDDPGRRNCSPAKNLKNLKNNHRGLDIIEGLWFYLFYPNLLSEHSVDLIGAKYSIECIPTIYQWNDHQFLSAICPDISDPMCGSPLVVAETTLSRKDVSNPDIIVSKIRTLYSTYFK